MAGTAPNATGSCDGGNGGHCYESPYQSFRVCLGPRATVIEGRRYNTLAKELEGRGPLSTHVKIDVEGSEWTILEQLLASDEDQDKIRTLDMEIHFGFRSASERDYDSWGERKRLEREVSIIEGLHRRFHVTGTTLETYRQGWRPDDDCPQQQCHEPIVHMAGGFSPQMFAVSFVNRKLATVARPTVRPLAPSYDASGAAPMARAPATPAPTSAPAAWVYY